MSEYKVMTQFQFLSAETVNMFLVHMFAFLVANDYKETTATQYCNFVRAALNSRIDIRNAEACAQYIMAFNPSTRSNRKTAIKLANDFINSANGTLQERAAKPKIQVAPATVRKKRLQMYSTELTTMRPRLLEIVEACLAKDVDFDIKSYFKEIFIQARARIKLRGAEFVEIEPEIEDTQVSRPVFAKETGAFSAAVDVPEPVKVSDLKPVSLPRIIVPVEDDEAEAEAEADAETPFVITDEEKKLMQLMSKVSSFSIEDLLLLRTESPDEYEQMCTRFKSMVMANKGAT